MGLVKILIEKDLVDVFKSKSILLSMLFLPLIFAVFMPLMFVGLPALSDSTELDPDLVRLVSIFPSLTGNWDSLDTQQKVLIGTSYLPLMFLVMLPAIIPSIIAAEAVAGEKERNTLESLLATPLSDSELLLGKILSSAIPAIIISWISCIPYLLITNISLADQIGFFVILDLDYGLRFVIMTVAIMPLVSFGSCSAMVFFSTKAKTARDAQQFSVFIILPLMMIALVQLFLALFSEIFLILGIVALLVVDFGLFQVARGSFSRESLISRL